MYTNGDWIRTLCSGRLPAGERPPAAAQADRTVGSHPGHPPPRAVRGRPAGPLVPEAVPAAPGDDRAARRHAAHGRLDLQLVLGGPVQRLPHQQRLADGRHRREHVAVVRQQLRRSPELEPRRDVVVPGHAKRAAARAGAGAAPAGEDEVGARPRGQVHAQAGVVGEGTGRRAADAATGDGTAGVDADPQHRAEPEVHRGVRTAGRDGDGTRGGVAGGGGPVGPEGGVVGPEACVVGPLVGCFGSYLATGRTPPSNRITPACSLSGSLKNTTPSRLTSWNRVCGSSTRGSATTRSWSRSTTQTRPAS